MRIFFTGQRRIVGQPLIHLTDHFRGSPFLRTEDSAASGSAAEHVPDIAGDAETAPGQLGDHKIICDGFQILKPGCSVCDRTVLFVQKSVAERLQHSDTAVVCRAAADPYDEPAAALSDGIADHFAHAIGGGVKRVPFLLRDKHKPCRSCHLDHCCGGSVYDPIFTHDRVAERTGDPDAADPAAHIAGQRFHRPFPAIGQRPDSHLR